MTKLLINYLAVGAAGFFGAILRYFVASTCGRWFGPMTSFPVGTMVINLTGSFFLGWFSTIVATRLIVSDTLRLAVATGFVGAYTTFSTYMYESNQLLGDSMWMALTNLVGSLVLGLIAVRLGIWMAG